eukprot:s114_g28.t1
MAIAISAAENARNSEAARHEDVEHTASVILTFGWMIATLISSIFLLVYFRFGHRIFTKLFAAPENDTAAENKVAHENVRAPNFAAVSDHDDTSEEIPDPANDIAFEETYAQQSHVDPSDEQLWREAYEIVFSEEAQTHWRKVSHEIRQHGHRARDWQYENTSTSARISRFQVKHPGKPRTSEEMQLWHRLRNISDGKYLAGYADGFAHSRPDAERLRAASEAQKIKNDNIRDKIIQTQCTWRNVHHGFSSLTENGTWGAWDHRNDLDDRD